MTRTAAALLLAALLAGPAGAATIEIDVPDADEAEAVTAAYACDDGSELRVTYHNAGPVGLAVFAVDGVTTVAATVVSASGARYAGGHWVWWTRGAEGSLFDAREGEDAAPVRVCSERG